VAGHPGDVIAEEVPKSRSFATGSGAPAKAASATAAASGVAVSDAAMHPSTAKSRKGLLWIAAAAVTVGALLGGFFFTRLVTALTEKDSILLTEFVNTTGDAVFDGTLKQALALQLEQSPYLNIVPQSKIEDALKYMGRPAGDRVTATWGERSASGPESKRC